MSKIKRVGEAVGRIKFSFRTMLRVYLGPAEWYYANLPEDLAAEIEELFADQKRGFGSLPVEVAIGDVVWQTSIFTDKKAKSFMLPIKAEVRKRVGLAVGDEFAVTMLIKV